MEHISWDQSKPEMFGHGEGPLITTEMIYLQYLSSIFSKTHVPTDDEDVPSVQTMSLFPQIAFIAQTHSFTSLLLYFLLLP